MFLWISIWFAGFTWARVLLIDDGVAIGVGATMLDIRTRATKTNFGLLAAGARCVLAE